MVLSNRLQTIADYVPNGACVADIGCDHALLSIYLAKSGRAKRVLACDVNEGPLAVARTNLQKAGVEHQIELRLCDGLAAVTEGEVDTVVIAGMGGELMVEILSAAPWVQSLGMTLVLQPMSRPEALRAYLYQSGFTIETEQIVTEHGHAYVLLKATYTGDSFTPTPLQAHLGALPLRDPAAAAYLTRLGHRLQKAADECAKSPRKAVEAQAFSALSQQILHTVSEMN